MVSPSPHRRPARSHGAASFGLIVVLGIVLLLAAVVVIDWLALIDAGPLRLDEISLAPEAFVELIRGWGAWGVGGSIGLMVLHSFLPFPAECLAIANGMVFGLWWGIVITWSGAMLGAFLAFALARRLGQPFVRRRVAGHRWQRLESWSGEHGWQTLLTARLVPVIAFNLINYAAGLTTVSWWTFTWTTAFGILPLTVLMVTLGEQMTDVPPWAWVALLALAVVSWWLLHRLRPRGRVAGEVAAGGER